LEARHFFTHEMHWRTGKTPRLRDLVRGDHRGTPSRIEKEVLLWRNFKYRHQAGEGGIGASPAVMNPAKP
jgi:hypothetical protein